MSGRQHLGFEENISADGKIIFCSSEKTYPAYGDKFLAMSHSSSSVENLTNKHGGFKGAFFSWII